MGTSSPERNPTSWPGGSIGCPLREEALRAAVPAGEIGQYFQNMDLDEFCGLMLC